MGAESERVDIPRSSLSFSTFVEVEGRQLRRLLVAHYGLDVGPDVSADAMAWAWEHWTELQSMENPVGYLYRVGQSAARRHHRWKRRVLLPREDPYELTGLYEPGLDAALAKLTAPQRVSVLLVHSLDWTYRDAAEAMGVPVSTLRNHLHRGMTRLRRELGED